MFKRLLLLGALAGVLAGAASIIYQKVYLESLGADFSKILKPAGIVAYSLIATIVASLLCWLLTKWMKRAGEIIFNLVFSIASIGSILAVFAVKLPLDMETPELFPGLTVPMLFFPALGWYTLKPLFVKSNGAQ